MRHLRNVLAALRKADETFSLIDAGDKIALGISGGKDSLCLMMAMHLYGKFSGKDFSIVPICLDLGFDGFDPAEIASWVASLGHEPARRRFARSLPHPSSEREGSQAPALLHLLAHEKSGHQRRGEGVFLQQSGLRPSQRRRGRNLDDEHDPRGTGRDLRAADAPRPRGHHLHPPAHLRPRKRPLGHGRRRRACPS